MFLIPCSMSSSLACGEEKKKESVCGEGLSLTCVIGIYIVQADINHIYQDKHCKIGFIF